MSTGTPSALQSPLKPRPVTGTVGTDLATEKRSPSFIPSTLRNVFVACAGEGVLRGLSELGWTSKLNIQGLNDYTSFLKVAEWVPASVKQNVATAVGAVHPYVNMGTEHVVSTVKKVASLCSPLISFVNSHVCATEPVTAAAGSVKATVAEVTELVKEVVANATANGTVIDNSVKAAATNVAESAPAVAENLAGRCSYVPSALHKLGTTLENNQEWLVTVAAMALTTSVVNRVLVNQVKNSYWRNVVALGLSGAIVWQISNYGFQQPVAFSQVADIGLRIGISHVAAKVAAPLLQGALSKASNAVNCLRWDWTATAPVTTKGARPIPGTPKKTN